MSAGSSATPNSKGAMDGQPWDTSAPASVSPKLSRWFIQQRVRSQSLNLRGAERATLLERFISTFHLPFSLGCLLLAFVFGPLGAALLTYVQTSKLDEAFAMAVILVIGEELPVWHGIVVLIIISAVLFFCPYMIRYLRLKTAAAKPALLPILRDGEETFEKAFSLVSRRLPPIVVGAALMTLGDLQCYPDLVLQQYRVFGFSPISQIFIVMCVCIWGIMCGTFTWVYFSSIWGLHKLGMTSLKLKSFREDKMLGARPIGLLSLSFAFVYFIFMGVFVSLIILLPTTMTPIFTGLLILLLTSGVFFFIVPLNTTHKRMLEEKRLEQEIVKKQITRIAETQKAFESSQTQTSEALDRLTTAIVADMTKKEIEAMPTWPFDTQILGRLAAMIITISCTLIANLIMRRWAPWG